MGPSIFLAVFVAFTVASTSPAHAGWTIEQVHYSMRPDGATIFSQESTVHVSKGRVRSRTPPLETILDFGKKEITLVLPAKKLYWRGTLEGYLDEIARVVRRRRFESVESADAKKAELEKKPDKRSSAKKIPEDEAAQVKIAKTEQSEEIGGHQATKYVVEVGRSAFQEVWIAPGISVDGDLDVKQLHAFEDRVNTGVRSKMAELHAIVLRDPQYTRLYEKGFPMRTRSLLGLAILGRDVKRITQEDLDETLFVAPDGYLRTDLIHLLDARDAAER